MNIRISLDHHALSALFPDGSEVRAELTRSIAANLLQKLALKDVKHLDADLRAQVSDFVKAEAHKIVGAPAWSGARVELSAQARQAITAEVDAQFRAAISAAAKPYWDDPTHTLQDAINKAIEHRAGSGLRALIREEVLNVLKAGVK